MAKATTTKSKKQKNWHTIATPKYAECAFAHASTESELANADYDPQHGWSDGWEGGDDWAATEEWRDINRNTPQLVHRSEHCQPDPEGLTVDTFKDLGVTGLDDFTPMMWKWIEEMTSWIDPADPDEFNGVAQEMSEVLELSEEVCAGMIWELQETGGYYPENEMPRTRGRKPMRFSKEFCQRMAEKCESKADFHRKHTKVYNRAMKAGWLNEITASLPPAWGHDNNAVYGWKVITAPEDVDMPAIGKHLIKFGVTSQKLKDKRVRQAAKSNRMTYDLIAVCDTSEGDARAFENVLLGMGEAANMPDWIDGKTEFVVLSDEQLNQAKQFLGAA